MLTLLIYVGFALQGPAPAEASKPEAAPAQSTAQEPAQPTGKEKDARISAALRTMVTELAPLVERETGLAFLADPIARVPTVEAWTAELTPKNGSPADAFEAATFTLGLFVVDPDEVWVSPAYSDALLAAAGPSATTHKGEIARLRCVLVHELVHCLQEQHYECITRVQAEPDPGKRYNLRALCEGHAVVVEERIATTEFGMKDYWATARKGYPMRTHGHYHHGRRYVRRLLGRENGRARLFELLQHGLNAEAPAQPAEAPQPERAKQPPPDKR